MEGRASLTKRDFLYSVLTLLLGVAALNGAVAFATRNSVPRRIMARVANSPQASVLAIGNSLMDAGLGSASEGGSRAGQSPRLLNLALGASTPVEQLLLLRYALQHHVSPRVIVYGFYDLQLSKPVALQTADLVGNSAMLYYVEPRYGRAFYSLSLHDRAEFAVLRHLPMIEDRGAFWAKVERLRRDLSGQGMPHEAANQFGRAADFSLLEPVGPKEFSEQCDAAALSDFNAPVREIIREGLASGARMIFLEMPIGPAHLRSFYTLPAWQRYRAHVSTLLAASGVEYVNATQWADGDDDFADHLHLNEAGAARFREKLQQLVSNSSPRVAVWSDEALDNGAAAETSGAGSPGPVKR